MPESYDHSLPDPLSTSGRRALAAAMLRTAAIIQPHEATVLIDALDGVCWGLLAVAGASRIEARAILAVMWTEPTTDVTAGPTP